MKNLFIALFMMAGTVVMAQTAGKADIQKELGITATQAEQVAKIQAKFCDDHAGCKLPEGKSKADMTEKDYRTAMAESQKAYYAALTDVIPEDKAKMLLAHCQKECDMAMAKSKSGKKSCCPGGKKMKKSCHEMKKSSVQ